MVKALIVVGLVLLAGCGEVEKKSTADNQPVAMMKPLNADVITIVQCDGQSVNVTIVDDVRLPPKVQSESRTFRINETKKVLEQWNEMEQKFSDLCGKECSLFPQQKSMSYISIQEEGSEKPGRIIDFDRVSGQIKDETKFYTPQASTLLWSTFSGSCRKVENPQPTQVKF